MGRIFLSYAREDRGCAERLARVLENAGHEVWWDRYIDGGEDFAAEIEAALEAAELIAVAWSGRAAKSPWVRDEATIGRDSGRLLPITIDGSQPPIGFRQFQALDLTGWKGRAKDSRTAALLQTVERRLKGKPAKISAKATQTSRSMRLRGWRAWSAAAALLLLIASAASLIIVRTTRVNADPASLAVLPFKNMAAGDPYFAEGVAEEIAEQLAREPQFRVAGRTSSALFKDAADLKDVGRRLHVAYVLEGSVRSAANQVRVAVSLVDAHRGTRMWSQDFRGSLNDIFAIQERIGQQVAVHVKKQLVATAANAPLVTSGEVYRRYVTAKSLMQLREPDKLAKAIDLLDGAVELDPNYAPAWAQLALARSLHRAYMQEGSAPPDPIIEEQELKLVDRAIVLAPSLAEAHAIAGMMLMDKADAAKTARARRELETAARLDPHNANTWYWLYNLRLPDLDFAGALDAIRRTASIDPFFVWSDKFPGLAWDMGQRDQAVRFYRDRIENHPTPYIREWAQTEFAMHRNDWSAAYQHVKRARDLAPPDTRAPAQGFMGNVLIQLELFEQAKQFVPAWIIALRRGRLPGGPLSNNPLDFWLADTVGPRPFPRVLVNNRRSDYLLSLYDRTFSSPDDMAARYPKLGFIDFAPLLAIAMDEAGRSADARRILALADAMVGSAVRRGDTPLNVQATYSRLWAALGRKELAISTLERAVAQGWRAEVLPKVSDEPAYRSIRDDPRLKRIDATIATDIARERRELLAAGL